MKRYFNNITRSIGALALLGLAACDYIHDDSLPLCEYRLRFVYDYNMKYADAFPNEVTKAALFICDDKGTCHGTGEAPPYPLLSRPAVFLQGTDPSERPSPS